MTLTHLHLHVRHRPVAEAFYARWLGMHTERREDTISFMKDAGGFLLVLMDDPAPQAMPGWFHFGALQPSREAVRALHDTMHAAGVPIVKPLQDDDGFAAFRASDPEGYVIEFYWGV